MFNEELTLARVWDSFEEMRQIRDDMSRVFGGPTVYRSGEQAPLLNVWADEGDVVVTAELPGVNPDDLDLSVSGNTLALRGHLAPAALGEGESYHRRERGAGAFVRMIELPFHVEAGQVNAQVSKGVL